MRYESKGPCLGRGGPTKGRANGDAGDERMTRPVVVARATFEPELLWRARFACRRRTMIPGAIGPCVAVCVGACRLVWMPRAPGRQGKGSGRWCV